MGPFGRNGRDFTDQPVIGQWACALPQDTLLSLAEQLLEIPRPSLEEALVLELAETNVVADTIDGKRCIFLPHLWRAEQVIAGGCIDWPGAAAMAGDQRRQGRSLGGGQAGGGAGTVLGRNGDWNVKFVPLAVSFQEVVHSDLTEDNLLRLHN